MPLSVDQARVLRESRPLGNCGVGERYPAKKKLGCEVTLKLLSNVLLAEHGDFENSRSRYNRAVGVTRSRENADALKCNRNS